MSTRRQPRTASLYRAQSRYAPYLFVAPFLILFLTFGLWPIVKSLILSLYVTNGPKSHVFVGFTNYQYLLSDPDFHTAVRNTVVYAFWSVFLQLPLALGLALLLTQKWVRGKEWLRLAFFSPHLVGQVFVGVLFSVLFVPQFGLLNRALHGLTSFIHQIIPAIQVMPLDTKWLGDASLVMPALVLTSLWMYAGYNMIYFLAALQSVDRELYEAAEVDGANSLQQFRAVTLPGIKPVATFVLVTSTIGSFQLFELPYSMLNSTAGPNKSGLTIVMYLYNTGFVSGDLGYASAVGWVLALGLLVVSLAQVRLAGVFRSAD